MANLITFNQKERDHFVEWHNDPDGWKFEEEKANQELRALMWNISLMLEKANEHPNDEDSIRLRMALRRLLKAEGIIEP